MWGRWGGCVIWIWAGVEVQGSQVPLVAPTSNPNSAQYTTYSTLPYTYSAAAWYFVNQPSPAQPSRAGLTCENQKVDTSCVGRATGKGFQGLASRALQAAQCAQMIKRALHDLGKLPRYVFLRTMLAATANGSGPSATLTEAP